MTALHVPPGVGPHHLMVDGDHVVKAAVHDAAGAFEVFEVIAPATAKAPVHVSPWTSVLPRADPRHDRDVPPPLHDEPGHRPPTAHDARPLCADESPPDRLTG